MAGIVEQLGTDMFREQHRIIAEQLEEISAELERVRTTGGALPEAVGALRRLLVLLEVDVERHAEEEEHAIYRLLERAEGMTPVLATCYREHGELRLGIERLRADLRQVLAGGPIGRLFDDSAALIALVQVHMAREDEILFTAAEQCLDRASLAAICEISTTHAGTLRRPEGGRR